MTNRAQRLETENRDLQEFKDLMSSSLPNGLPRVEMGPSTDDEITTTDDNEND